MPSWRAVSGGRGGNSWEGAGPRNPAEPPAARSRLCPGTLCFTAPTAPPAPHRGHRARHRTPCSCLGNPSHREKASLRNRPRAEGWRMCPIGPQARHGPSDYFGAALQGCGSRAARKRCAACPGTRRSYARNVHAHGWPPARPCRGTSPTSALPAALVTPGPAPGKSVGAVPRGRAAPSCRGASPLWRSQHLGGDLEHGSSRAEKSTAGDGEPGPWGG